MIKNIITGGDLRVTYSNSRPYISPGAQGAGFVRWNTNMDTLEVYDGVVWKDITTTITVELGTESQEILNWAKNEMNRQSKIRDLAKKYPIVSELQDQLDVMVGLLQENVSESAA